MKITQYEYREFKIQNLDDMWFAYPKNKPDLVLDLKTLELVQSTNNLFSKNLEDIRLQIDVFINKEETNKIYKHS